jgi:hypothetical protein
MLSYVGLVPLSSRYPFYSDCVVHGFKLLLLHVVILGVVIFY